MSISCMYARHSIHRHMLFRGKGDMAWHVFVEDLTDTGVGDIMARRQLDRRLIMDGGTCRSVAAVGPQRKAVVNHKKKGQNHARADFKNAKETKAHIGRRNWSIDRCGWTPIKCILRRLDVKLTLSKLVQPEKGKKSVECSRLEM